MREKEWYKISVPEVFDELKTSVDGLSMKEALRRQDKFGKNIIPRRKNKSVFSIFCRVVISVFSFKFIIYNVECFLVKYRFFFG